MIRKEYTWKANSKEKTPSAGAVKVTEVGFRSEVAITREWQLVPFPPRCLCSCYPDNEASGATCRALVISHATYVPGIALTDFFFYSQKEKSPSEEKIRDVEGIKG